MAKPGEYTSAEAWAEARGASESVRLGMVEAQALKGRPEVLGMIGPDGAAIKARLDRQNRPAAVKVGSIVLGIIAILGLLSPILGMAVNVQPNTYEAAEGVPGRVGVPLALIAFWVTVAALVVVGIAWLRDRRELVGLALGFGAVCVAMGFFALFNIPRNAARDDLEVTPIDLLPVIASVALGLILVIDATRTRRRMKAEPEPPTAIAVETPIDMGQASSAIAAIPSMERTLILDDRNAALVVLHRRGLIDDAHHSRARQAALGTLWTFDPPV